MSYIVGHRLPFQPNSNFKIRIFCSSLLYITLYNQDNMVNIKYVYTVYYIKKWQLKNKMTDSSDWKWYIEVYSLLQLIFSMAQNINTYIKLYTYIYQIYICCYLWLYKPVYFIKDISPYFHKNGKICLNIRLFSL